MTHNPYRGALTVDLAGAPQTLRLTFDDMVRLESLLDCSLFTLAQRFADGQATCAEMASLLQVAASEADKPVDVAVINQALEQDGLSFHLETCLQLLTLALGGLTPPKPVRPLTGTV